MANMEKLDELYDKLVKNRTAQAKEMGYENFVELGYYKMMRNCYGKEEVEAFRQQVKEYLVPFAEKLHDRRRQRHRYAGGNYRRRAENVFGNVPGDKGIL